MVAVQQLLFPDPKPLVERLGRDFFRALPTRPGVYFLRAEAGEILYIGKAKSLRQRLTAYRVANPGRMKRRHLRLLGAAAAIDFEECVSEEAALAREAELLLAHRPRFNRAGVWQGPARFLAWQRSGADFHIELTSEADPNRPQIGPVGSGRAKQLRGALSRLLWLAAFPAAGIAELPCGWIHGRFPAVVTLPWKPIEPLAEPLNRLADGVPQPLCDRIQALVTNTEAFATEQFERDLESLRRVSATPDVAD